MATRLQKVLAAIDAFNQADPHRECGQPKEWLYGQRMSQRLAQFQPQASELLQVAVRGQHVGRWLIPRSDYPMDRDGYRKWRTALGMRHGEIVAELASQCGYGADETRRLQAMLRKEKFKVDPETQTLEDVACLVFLEHYFEVFAQKHDRDKVVQIVAKTWKKMSPAGQAHALTLPLSNSALALVRSAVGA